jgi:hypothetical protein
VSALFLAPNGTLFSHAAEVCVIRWGGGADIGKYHVFLIGTGYGFFPVQDRQCVVDDFGNLVPVDGSGS